MDVTRLVPVVSAAAAYCSPCVTFTAKLRPCRKAGAIDGNCCAHLKSIRSGSAGFCLGRVCKSILSQRGTGALTIDLSPPNTTGLTVRSLGTQSVRFAVRALFLSCAGPFHLPALFRAERNFQPEPALPEAPQTAGEESRQKFLPGPCVVKNERNLGGRHRQTRGATLGGDGPAALAGAGHWWRRSCAGLICPSSTGTPASSTGPRSSRSRLWKRPIWRGATSSTPSTCSQFSAKPAFGSGQLSLSLRPRHARLRPLRGSQLYPGHDQ